MGQVSGAGLDPSWGWHCLSPAHLDWALKFLNPAPCAQYSLQGHAIWPFRLPRGLEVWRQGSGSYHFHRSPPDLSGTCRPDLPSGLGVEHPYFSWIQRGQDFNRKRKIVQSQVWWSKKHVTATSTSPHIVKYKIAGRVAASVWKLVLYPIIFFKTDY